MHVAEMVAVYALPALVALLIGLWRGKRFSAWAYAGCLVASALTLAYLLATNVDGPGINPVGFGAPIFLVASLGFVGPSLFAKPAAAIATSVVSWAIGAPALVFGLLWFACRFGGDCI